jgi:hypothetical protein
MMQLFTEQGWSIVINKKRVGLLVLGEGDGPALITSGLPTIRPEPRLFDS